MYHDSFVVEMSPLNFYVTFIAEYHLLQELLKHTPTKHPDSHHIANAIDKLHGGLIVLNRSIKLCLLACSVKQVQDQKSFRFLKSSRKVSTQR